MSTPEQPLIPRVAPPQLGEVGTRGTLYMSVNAARTEEVSTPEVSEGVVEQMHTLAVAEGAKHTENDIANAIKEFMRRVPGYRDEERVDFWESQRHGQAAAAKNEARHVLRADTSSWGDTDIGQPKEDKDIFGIINSRVAYDLLGTTDPKANANGPDIVDFAVGKGLDELLDGQDLLDPTVLEKATQTIRLLSAYGRYKFAKWNSGKQLQVALDLMKSYAQYVPDFDLQAAGALEAKADLTVCAAAVQLDQRTKPNFRYAKPERAHTLWQATNGLASLDVAIAHGQVRLSLEAEQAA